MRHALWLVLALGCPGPVAPLDTDDTDVDVPMVETDCDDQIDEDADSLVDCADDDCAAEPLCAWPGSLDFESVVFFDANTLAKIGGQSDCTVVTTSVINRDRNEETCAACDRVFCGTFSYPQDNCPQDPSFPRPTEGCFGFTFVSDTDWTMYGRNPEDQTWEEVASVTGNGPLEWSSSAPLELEGVDVGTLTTSFSVSPL